MIASPHNRNLSRPTSQTQPATSGDNQPLPPKTKSEPINKTTVLVALIGALATILAAFFASPVAENIWHETPPAIAETEVIVHIADELGAAVDGAKVSLFFESGQFNKWTYSNGAVKFLLPLPDGEEELDVSMTVEHDEYQIYNRQFELPVEKLLEIRLNKKNKHSAKVIMRVVDDQNGIPLGGKNVLLLVQGDTYNQTTDSNGIAEFVLPFPEGKIDAKISITPQDYEAQYQHVTLLPNKVQDLRLSGKENTHSVNLPNNPSLIATPTPIHVVVVTPQAAPIPPTAAGLAPTLASPTAPAIADVGSVNVIKAPHANEGVITSISLQVGSPSEEEDNEEDNFVISVSDQENSIEDTSNTEPNQETTETQAVPIAPTQTEIVATSTPMPIPTENNPTHTATAIPTEKISTDTPTHTATAIPTEKTPTDTPTHIPTAIPTEKSIISTPTMTATTTAIKKEHPRDAPTVTATEYVATSTPTVTVTEPSASKTPIPTITEVAPTATSTIISVTVTIVPTNEASEEEEDANSSDVIVIEEPTSEPTVTPTTETTIPIEPSATPIPTVIASATPIPTATPTIIIAETDESEETATTEEALQVEEEANNATEEQELAKDETLQEEESTSVEEEPTIENQLEIDAYPEPDAYP